MLLVFNLLLQLKRGQAPTCGKLPSWSFFLMHHLVIPPMEYLVTIWCCFLSSPHWKLQDRIFRYLSWVFFMSIFWWLAQCPELIRNLQQFLSNKNTILGLHSAYSLDLAPSDFQLFPKVKMTLSGQYFELSALRRLWIVQLKTLMKGLGRITSESGKNDSISVFEKGSFLRRINGNMPFNVIHF